MTVTTAPAPPTPTRPPATDAPGKRRWWLWLLAVVPVVFLLPPLMLVMMVGGSGGACGPIPTLELAPGGAQIAGLNPQQTRIAATAVGRVAARKLPAKAAIIVIAVGQDESGLRNLSNPAVPESMSLPNDGVGFDGGSVGYLQQQPQYGWGTAQELMNPAIATDRFLNALIKIPGWQSMDPAQAATTVQRNATGAAAYQEFMGSATKIVASLSDNSQVTDYVETVGSDAAAAVPEQSASPGTQVKPMKDGTYQVSSPFGPRGGEQHQGIDLAAPVNTPFYSVADGTVVDAGPASGFGQWIVLNHQIDGKLFATVYGHMYPDGVLVKKGQKVTAGQLIGKVGNNGQSTGAHLHFEVWDSGHRDFDGGHAINPAAWATTGTNPSGAAAPGNGDAASGGAACLPQAPVPGGADIEGFRPGGPAGPNIVAAAASQMGIRYSWGGGDLNGPTKGISDGGGAGDAHQDYAIPGWDCSALTRYAVHKATGKTIARTSQPQSTGGIPVPDEAHAEPGDLVFFGGQGSATHVGIYMGGGKMVNAPQSGTKVRIDNIHNGFSKPITFRRYH